MKSVNIVTSLLTVLVQMSSHAVSDMTSQPSPASCYLTTACSASCGEGFRLLLPNSGQLTCMPGVLKVLPCMERVCPGDCRWKEWSVWSGCYQSCTQRRERARERSASHGGTECTGEEYEERDCCQSEVSTCSMFILFLLF
jgi:hypothetical protein